MVTSLERITKSVDTFIKLLSLVMSLDLGDVVPCDIHLMMVMPLRERQHQIVHSGDVFACVISQCAFW